MKILQIVLYIILMAIFVTFLIVSIHTNNWSWFARSGSLITIIPVLISVIEMYTDRKQIYFAKHNYCKLAPKDVAERAKRYWPIKILVNLIITIIGTIIWGFGDLLNNIF